MKNSEKSIEFEKWLESIGGLENGWFTDKPPITSRGFFSIGDGWLDLTRELIEKSISLGWDKQILQVKEKFGGLRFYTNSAPNEVHDLISEYEKKSYKTCEECGEPGDVRSGSWVRTLCDNHYKLSNENKQ